MLAIQDNALQALHLKGASPKRRDIGSEKSSTTKLKWIRQFQSSCNVVWGCLQGRVCCARGWKMTLQRRGKLQAVGFEPTTHTGLQTPVVV
eukprot:923204-Pelagomonas_calceolata.AAC.1